MNYSIMEINLHYYIPHNNDELLLNNSPGIEINRTMHLLFHGPQGLSVGEGVFCVKNPLNLKAWRFLVSLKMTAWSRKSKADIAVLASSTSHFQSLLKKMRCSFKKQFLSRYFKLYFKLLNYAHHVYS